ncbi:MAG: hypothetical protein R3C53_19100 [Pirellulaceae bacterium]
MGQIEPINDGNREQAISALCRVCDDLTTLCSALFGYLHNDSEDPDRLQALRALFLDDLVEWRLALASDVVGHWKDYLEIREQSGKEYAAYLFAETYKRQNDIDAELNFHEFASLYQQVAHELGGADDQETEVQIRATAVARWLGISELA